MIKKAIIPAAGLGTRFLPATKAQPKEMLPLVDKPTIQYIVEEAIDSGIEDIIIVTGRNKRAIEDHFDRSVELELTLFDKANSSLLEIVESVSNMVDIHYIRQKAPLGLGHAIFCARKFVGNEPFAVLLGDDVVISQTPCLKQLINIYEEKQTSIIGVQAIDIADVHKYGIIQMGEINQGTAEVIDMVEKPKENPPSNIAIIGRYILEADIFKHLSVTKPGANGEIQLTDALRSLALERKLLAHTFQGKRYDVGDKIGYLKATVDLALQRDELKEEFLDYLKCIVR